MKTALPLRLFLLVATAPALCGPAWAENGFSGFLQNPFKPKSSETKPAPPSAGRTVPWSATQIAARQGEMRRAARRRHARIRGAAADQGGGVRGARADPRQVDRKRSQGRHRAGGQDQLRGRGGARQVAQGGGPAGSHGDIRRACGEVTERRLLRLPQPQQCRARRAERARARECARHFRVHPRVSAT